MKQWLASAVLAMSTVIPACDEGGLTARAKIEGGAGAGGISGSAGGGGTSGSAGGGAAGEDLNVGFPESHEPLKNPDKGWVVYAFNPFDLASVDDYPLASIVYTNYVTWADFEPVDDAFDWSLLEGLVQWARQRRKSLHIAINSVDPTSLVRVQIPYWFINDHPGAGRWVTQWYGNAVDPNFDFYGQPGYIYEPDYASASYQQEYTEFLHALSDRMHATGPYSGQQPWTDVLGLVEHSHYGYWGEWHGEWPWPNDQVKLTTLQTMAGWNFAMFPNTATEISALFDDPNNAVATTVERGAGMVRKCIGICHHGYLSSEAASWIAAFHPWSPFRGEWGSWSGKLDWFYDSPTSPTPVNDTLGAVDEALAFRIDTLGWYATSPLDQPVAGGESLADYFQRQAGYRHYLESASLPRQLLQGGQATLSLVWHQRGVNKLYRTYSIELMLRGQGAEYLLAAGALDAHHWPPGPGGPYPTTTTLTIPSDLPADTYTAYLALTDEVGRPAVNLAIVGDKLTPGIEPSYYRLGDVEVIEP